MNTALLQRLADSVRNPASLSGGKALLVGAALGLGLISVFTFRVAEGFVFSIAAMSACGLAYGLTSRIDGTS